MHGQWSQRPPVANQQSRLPAVRYLRREFRQATPPLLAAKNRVPVAAGPDRWALQRTAAHGRHLNLVSEISFQKS
jgi:hypothetical protein